LDDRNAVGKKTGINFWRIAASGALLLTKSRCHNLRRVFNVAIYAIRYILALMLLSNPL